MKMFPRLQQRWELVSGIQTQDLGQLNNKGTGPLGQWDLHSPKTLDRHNPHNGSRSWSKATSGKSLPFPPSQTLPEHSTKITITMACRFSNIYTYTLAQGLREPALESDDLALILALLLPGCVTLDTHQTSLSLSFISSETGK